MQPILTEQDIDDDIDQGTKFLRTLSTRSEVRRIMEHNGYRPKEHLLGWSLLLELCGYGAGQAEPEQEPLPQERAIAELDSWDGPGFQRARPALHRLHPEQEAYVFEALHAATGAAAVGSVNTFLDRVAALRDGTDGRRAGTREADKAAAATLRERNIVTAEIEAHLRKLIEQATELAPSPPPEEEPKPEQDEHYQGTARKFHAWLIDWGQTARAVINRRQYLIWLGLTEPRRSPPTGEGAGAAEPVVL